MSTTHHYETKLAESIKECRKELGEERRTRETLTALLQRSAIALKGPEPEGTMWDWSDLPARVEELLRERDALRDELQLAKDLLNVLDEFLKVKEEEIQELHTRIVERLDR